MLVTDIVVMKVAVTRGGIAADALHTDGKTVLGPWIKFLSAEGSEMALVYLGKSGNF